MAQRTIYSMSKDWQYNSYQLASIKFSIERKHFQTTNVPKKKVTLF